MTISDFHTKLLTGRGLDPKLCADLGFRTVNGALAHDYRLNGKVINTKLRKGKGDMPFLTKWEKTVPPLWNVDALKPEPKAGEALVITEGELDGATVAQAGFARAVSVPLGAGASGGRNAEYGFLYEGIGKKLHPDIDKFERIVLAVDGDEKGNALFEDLAVRLGRHRCYGVNYPENCKDPNDLLQRGLGVDGVRDLINSAKLIWSDSIGRMSDFRDRDGAAYGTGIEGLNLKIELPSFLVMVGPFHCGKSTFLRQFLWSLWKTNGWPFLLTCLEEPIKPRMQSKFRSLAMGRMATQGIGIAARAEMMNADEEIDRAAVLLERPRSRLLTPNMFFDMVETAVLRYGLKVVALDPVNELDHHIEGNETHYWGGFILDCKALADRYGLLFIASGHPAKQAYQNLRTGYPLSAIDMSGSQNWGNKGDITMCLWRPDRISDRTFLHLEKTKDHSTMGKAPWLYELTHQIDSSFKITGEGWDLMKAKKDD